MTEKFFLYPATLFSVLLLVLHLLAFKFFLYWQYAWYDVVTHMIGGFVVGLLIQASRKDKLRNIFFTKKLLIITLLVLLVGVFWEIFEVSIGATFTSLNYKSDTILDLSTTVFGGVLSIFYSKIFERKLNQNE